MSFERGRALRSLALPAGRAAAVPCVDSHGFGGTREAPDVTPNASRRRPAALVSIPPFRRQRGAPRQLLDVETTRDWRAAIAWARARSSTRRGRLSTSFMAGTCQPWREFAVGGDRGASPSVIRAPWWRRWQMLRPPPPGCATLA
jgi:hypothetical protein